MYLSTLSLSCKTSLRKDFLASNPSRGAVFFFYFKPPRGNLYLRNLTNTFEDNGRKSITMAEEHNKKGLQVQKCAELNASTPAWQISLRYKSSNVEKWERICLEQTPVAPFLTTLFARSNDRLFSLRINGNFFGKWNYLPQLTSPLFTV